MYACQILEVINDTTLLIEVKIKKPKLLEVFTFKPKIKLIGVDRGNKQLIEQWMGDHSGLIGYFAYDIETYAMKLGKDYSLGKIAFVGEYGVDILNDIL